MGKTKAEYLVGVDFGGTKILAGVYTHALELIGLAKLSTKAHRSADHVVERIARAVREAVDGAGLTLADVRAVGLGAPGAVDGESGRILFAPNLGWRDVPLKENLQRLLGLPVFLENDANVAALGAYVWELQSRPRYMLGVFVGTGIGGGLIINGQLYHGFRHTAGEIGHMVIDVNGPPCGCGNRGCLEAVASRTAMFRTIKTAVQNGQKTLLTDLLGTELDDMRSGDLRKAIHRGDAFVRGVVEDAARAIGLALASLVNILSPEVIVLGGGVIEALQDEMMGLITQTTRERAMPGTMQGVEIIASALADNLGITGAAVLARQMGT